MSIWTLFTLAVGLSMDAFAVSVCKGLALRRVTPKNCILVGIWFGGFQALMPLIGYVLGTQFEQYIVAFDHWIAFALLLLIGGNMIRESRSKEEACPDGSLAIRDMFILAIATSIDALAIGITLAFLRVNIVSAVSFIGILTFIISVIGVKAGSLCGAKYKSKAEMVGGIILIFLGSKILFEHLAILG